MRTLFLQKTFLSRRGVSLSCTWTCVLLPMCLMAVITPGSYSARPPLHAPQNNHRVPRFPGRPMETEEEDYCNQQLQQHGPTERNNVDASSSSSLNDRKVGDRWGTSLFGMGREFDLFDNRVRTEAPPPSSQRMDLHAASTTEGNAAHEEHADDDDASNVVGPLSSLRTSKMAQRFRSSTSATAASSNNLPYHLGSSPSSVSNQPIPKRTTALGSMTGGATMGSSSASFSSASRMRQKSSTSSSSSSFFQPVAGWWTNNITPNIKSWPRIKCRMEPTTTLKLRKTFRPLKTIVQLGADYNTQLGVWQFRSSWEDAIIGGKLTLAGRELQLSKSWQLSVGAVEDLVTRLRFRAAVDLQTWKAYARVGFRTERLSPINVMEGFTLMKQVPLDGVNNGHVKLEIKANFALPEPEIEYSTETHRSLMGMGDIEVNIEELNLLLDY